MSQFTASPQWPLWKMTLVNWQSFLDVCRWKWFQHIWQVCESNFLERPFEKYSSCFNSLTSLHVAPPASLIWLFLLTFLPFSPHLPPLLSSTFLPFSPPFQPWILHHTGSLQQRAKGIFLTGFWIIAENKHKFIMLTHSIQQKVALELVAGCTLGHKPYILNGSKWDTDQTKKVKEHIKYEIISQKWFLLLKVVLICCMFKLKFFR